MKTKRKVAKSLFIVFLIASIITSNISFPMATNNKQNGKGAIKSEIQVPDANNKEKPSEKNLKGIIVKYKDNNKKTKDKVKDKLKKRKMKSTRELPNTSYGFMEFSENENITEVINELGQDSNIESIQLNYELDLYTINYEAEGVSDAVYSESIIGNIINVQQAWEISKGSNDVIIGVLDGDVDTNHSELVNRLYRNPGEIAGDGIDNDSNGYIDDVNSWDFANNDNTIYDSSSETHGTLVSGIIAAEKNGKGIAGIAPGARILPVKIANGTKGTVWDAINAIKYVEELGATIVNCSWGTDKYSPILEDVIRNSKMLFVCAAGNDRTDSKVYPAGYDLPNVISVGSVDEGLNLASFSNYGDSVDIAAPGVDIYSTLPESKYGYISGTSASAPFVSGVAALIKSNNNDLTAGEVAAIIKSNFISGDILNVVDAGKAVKGIEDGAPEEELESELSKLQALLEEQNVSDEYKAQIMSLFEEGYNTTDIWSCYSFCKVFDLSVKDAFSNDEAANDFDLSSSGYSEEEIELIKEISLMYNIRLSFLNDVIKNSGMTVEEIKQKLIDEEVFYELSDADNSEADFKANRGQYSYNKINNESINLNSGSLTIESTDLSLPGRNGLDLNIVTRYNSSESNLYKMAKYSIGECRIETDNEIINLLGSGWSFGFSWLESYNSDSKYIHLSDGSTYFSRASNTIDSGYEQYYIQNYELNKMNFYELHKDEFSYGGYAATYVLVHNDGKKEYFSNFGRLIGIVDQYGNSIKFQYEYVPLAENGVDRKDYRLKKIVDSVGRVITFVYENTTTGKKLQ